MRLILSALTVILLVVTSASPQQRTNLRGETRGTAGKAATIWRQPYDIRTRNLFYGPGGEAGQPKPPFRFVEADRGGSNPKFVVRDASGVQWKVKLGNEAKPETTATRLLWAVGYFTDTNYYLPTMGVAGLPKLRRGQEYVRADGIVQGARLERVIKKVDDWSWFDNPFVATREFDGLRVMMALMNNWDLKQSNNGIHDIRGIEHRYFVSDLGDTFGQTGDDWNRSQGDLKGYLQSTFIDKTTNSHVDLTLKTRPPMLYMAALPYYIKRVRMGKVADEIPREHGRWIGQWLGQLSDGQISDAFRAAGFSPSEVNAYARKVRERINQLNAL